MYKLAINGRSAEFVSVDDAHLFISDYVRVMIDEAEKDPGIPETLYVNLVYTKPGTNAVEEAVKRGYNS